MLSTILYKLQNVQKSFSTAFCTFPISKLLILYLRLSCFFLYSLSVFFSSNLNEYWIDLYKNTRAHIVFLGNFVIVCHCFRYSVHSFKLIRKLYVNLSMCMCEFLGSYFILYSFRVDFISFNIFFLFFMLILLFHLIFLNSNFPKKIHATTNDALSSINIKI